MLIIGLTGGIGSGKTTAATLFQECGAAIIDADEISRVITKKGLPAYHEIVTHFGNQVLDENQEIKRDRLREIIFQHESERKWLEACLHPRIREAMKEEAEKTKAPYCIFVIPLLAETKKNPLIQRVCVVDIRPAMQLTRITNRDKITPEFAKKIMASQADRDERLRLADDIIDNSGDIKELQKQIRVLHEKYLKL